MLKITVAVLAVALAGNAGAAGWRDLRVDGSSEAAFQQSLAVFKDELSPERQRVFQGALMDIWIQGTTDAKANEREYTTSDYYQQLHGLSYDEVVTFTDPTGETAKARKREADRQVVESSQPELSPFPANQKQRMERAHQGIDSGDLMRTRQGGQTTRGGNGLTGPGLPGDSRFPEAQSQ
jgi:hypothetical protein